MKDSTSSYSSPQELAGLVGNAAITLWVAVIIFYALAMYFLVPRGSEIDELGLFNPVYMKVHYGRMTYPIYGYFNSMFVHPPLRYEEVAALMRMGMPLPYAEQFMVCLLTMIIGLCVAFSRFDPLSKLSLSFGFFAGLVWMAAIDEHTYTLRPDTQLALAWFLGLVLLQDAFLRGWNLPRLFLGAFTLTYASGLHYFGVVAFLGITYYFAMAYRRLSGKRLQQVLTALLGGGLFFGIPYLVLFVIPDWRDILRFSREVQSAGNWLSPITRHFDQYAYWRASYPPGLLLHEVLEPVFWLRVPLLAAGAAMLALRRDTRGLAIASLPLTLLVFAYSQGKSAGYYLPEFLIYFSGIAILICLLLRLVAERFIPRFAGRVTALVFVAGAGWATRGGYPEYAAALTSYKPLIPAMDIARACAKQLLGPNAFVGGRIGLWYISGAQSWYDVAPDLLWKKDISGISLPEYFSKFDYVVEHDHMSNTTVNAGLQSLPSWYVSGVLKLQGFIFNQQHSNMNILVFKTEGSSPLAGYITDDQKVLRFDQDPQGDYVFGSRVCQFESWPAINRWNLPHFNAIYLPKGGAEDPSRSFLPAAKPGGAQSAVVTFVMTAGDFAARRVAIDKECGSLNTVAGRLTEVDLKELLAKWRTQESPMQFSQSLEDRLPSRIKTEVIHLPSFDLEHLVVAYQKAKIVGDRVKRVVTAAQPYSSAAALEIPLEPLPEPAWIAIRQRVIKGQIGIGILDKKRNTYSTRRFVAEEDRFETIYLPLKSAAEPRTLIIENGDSGTSSTVDVEDIRVVHGTSDDLH